jgi:predicted CoA-binding protein
VRSPREILATARVVAVVGCSNESWRDSNRIATYLKRVGYRVYPVNPTIETAVGEKCYPDLKSLPEPVDIVNVFRHPRFVPDVIEDAIEAGAPAVWLQLGVGNPEAEMRAENAGLEVVSERCIMVDHRNWGIAPVEQREEP